ncbi:MAG: sugar ABC transporter permease [Chloroflexi bacterium]|nr:sugar ABC transporter permease [Chloroflexota bacterium]MCI0579396.1 sugar ABC transporter permease [Chloroflexota bacterium]MCI0643778.1 sugar ABC transporter permease [Chloroflexota bacterium]MCI0730034.1 sugar ABC transporter permease [Chloroflexota bacterium]
MANRTFSPRLSYHTRLRLLLLPYALGIIVLVVLPAALSFGLAFFQYDALSPPRWVGRLNFILAYTDELFNLSVQNSLSLIILPVPLRVFGAFLLARLMQRGGRFLGWFRASVYLPSTIPTAAYALAWLWIFNPLYGPLNLLLRAIGLEPPAWFVDPQWARPALVVMSLWQIGEGFLVSLAALQDLPPEIEDAARVDGANAWQLFWSITLPLVAPILLLLMFRDAILTFQESFATILLATGGGPYYATYTLPLFIYEQSFDLLLFGTASAALWVMYGLTGLIVVILFVIARQWNIGTTEETFVL